MRQDKRRRSIRTRAICLLLSLLAGHAAADGDPWSAGIEAFSRGDYATALGHFEVARAAGQAGPAVHYNIAVCEFELGNYDAADAGFRHIAERFTKMRPLANYNRGLVAVEQDRNADARRLFLAAYQEADDEQLRILASTMLRRIGAPAPATAADRFTGVFGAGAGHDDNVVLRDDAGVPIDTETESAFAELYGTLSAPIGGRRDLRFDASAYLVSYFDTGDFDQAAAAIGVAWQGRTGESRFEAGVSAGLSTLGGDRFDDTLALRGRWDYAPGPNSLLRFDLEFAEIGAGDSAFDGVAGSRQRAGVRYRAWRGLQSVEVGYGLERNDRDDASVSASHDRLWLHYRVELDAKWGLDAGIEYRQSDFDDLDPRRNEDRTGLTIAARRVLRTDWQLLLRYGYYDNDSSDELFGYTRSVLSAGVLKTF